MASDKGKTVVRTAASSATRLAESFYPDDDDNEIFDPISNALAHGSANPRFATRSYLEEDDLDEYDVEQFHEPDEDPVPLGVGPARQFHVVQAALEDADRNMQLLLMRSRAQGEAQAATNVAVKKLSSQLTDLTTLLMRCVEQQDTILALLRSQEGRKEEKK